MTGRADSATNTRGLSQTRNSSLNEAIKDSQDAQGRKLQDKVLPKMKEVRLYKFNLQKIKHKLNVLLYVVHV